MDRPHPSSRDARPFVDSEEAQLNPAFTFGVRQGRTRRAADDLNMGGTKEAAAIHFPVEFPPRDLVPRISKGFGENSCVGRFFLAKWDNADAFTQFLMRAEDQLTAAVVLARPWAERGGSPPLK